MSEAVLEDVGQKLDRESRGEMLPEVAEQSEQTEWQLPGEPVIQIRPSQGLAALNLSEIWAYRELLYFLAWRDIKVRYKQTILGVAWAVIQPLMTAIIFTIFFGRIAQMPSDGIPYPIFSYAGLQLWTFFSNALSSSGNSLVGSQNLITKVYFPRMVIPGAAVVAGLVDFAIAGTILIGMLVYYQVAISVQILMAPVLILMVALLALGVGMWMSGLNVKYRDIRYALPFMIQLGLFVSPIIWPLSKIPEKWHWLVMLNPLTGILEGWRAALFGLDFHWPALGVSALITLGFLVYAAFSFRKMERTFADVV